MRLLFLLPIILASCAVPTAQNPTKRATENANKVKLEIPNATWVPIYFRAINERAKVARLDDLRSILMSNDDLEIRIWRGFGVTALDGYVIKRTKGEWTGLKIPPINVSDPNSHENIVITPKSGWSQLWKRLTNEGLIDLPDSSLMTDQESFLDGVSYVVEINMKSTYRTYMYGDPENQNSAESTRMVRVAHILQEEFGV